MSKQTDLINIPDAITVSGSNVGIGTSSPTLTAGATGVDIYDNSDAQIRLHNSTTGTTASDGLLISLASDNAGYFYNYENAPVIVGTNNSERMRIDATGAVTMPHQPAFLAQPASTQLNVGTSTTVTVVFGGERFDQNADFASNTFTAPVTGKYQLSYSLYLTNIDSAATYYEIYIQTSNRAYGFVIDPNFASDLSYLTLTGSVLADMDASDTSYVSLRMQGGTAQTDIATPSYFSGYLVA